MIKKPIIKPCLTVEVITENRIILFSEDTSHIVEQPIKSRILAELSKNTQLDSEQLSQRLQPIPAAQIYFELLSLEKDGFIIERNEFFSLEQQKYWTHMGFCLSKLQNRLETQPLHLINLSQADDSIFLKVFKENHITMVDNTDDGNLIVVLTDDYTTPILSDLQLKFTNHHNKRWLLIKPTGSTIWLGPLFGNDQHACWHCLEQRLQLHKTRASHYQVLSDVKPSQPSPAQSPQLPIINSPGQQALAAQLTALELIKWLYHSSYNNQAQIESCIFSMDTVRMQSHWHTVVKRPQCSFCGNANNLSSQPPPPIHWHQHIADHQETRYKTSGYRAQSADKTFLQYQHHISPICGVVPFIKAYHPIENAPIYNYLSGRNLALRSHSLFWLNQHLRSSNGGKGSNKQQAKTSALCEAIERYSMIYHQQNYHIKARFEQLEHAIHPNQCMNFSAQQFKQRQDNNTDHTKFYALTPLPFPTDKIMSWTPVYSLSQRHFKYLPSCYCYAQYPSQQPESALYAYPDSNGVASGNTLGEAILHGLLELIERDSAAIWWYNKIRRPAVDLNSINNDYLQQVISYYQSINRSLTVLDISSDLDIPVFVAISACINSTPEKIIYAFGAHVDATIAIERAIVELNQLLPIVIQPHYLTDDRVFIDWLNTATVKKQTYLTADRQQSSKNLQTDYSTAPTTVAASIDYCLQQLTQNNIELLALDLTQPDIGLPVAKVIAPGLRHFWRRMAAGRLYDVPVKMGWLAKPYQEQAMNVYDICI